MLSLPLLVPLLLLLLLPLPLPLLLPLPHILYVAVSIFSLTRTPLVEMEVESQVAHRMASKPAGPRWQSRPAAHGAGRRSLSVFLYFLFHGPPAQPVGPDF